MSQIKIGLLGGTGLGDAIGAQASGQRHDLHTPFGKPSDSILQTQWAGLDVFILSRHGPGHLLNPSRIPYRANIFALKELGCTHVIASGAVGSLRQEFKPRDLVIVDQIIDKTYGRKGTFFDEAAVHVEMAEPFCPVLRPMILEAGRSLAAEAALTVHERGCYLCMEGPAFSTRAESLMHRLWGADLIGMTVMPEAKLAREAEMSYALIALVTDYDCWRQPASPGSPASTATAAAPVQADPAALLKEIIGNLEAASHNAMTLIQRSVELMAQRQAELANCPAHDALRLAIWSDKTRIPPEQVKRLGPLWMKYF